MYRYRNDEFSNDTKHTIGVEFATQEIEIEDKRVKIQIWDTAGQERYRAITKAYYRGALGAILLYDITETETFENLNKWINEIKTNSAPDIKIMLVGNKKDLEDKRSISMDVATKLAKEHSMAFLEASAKSGDLVIECFETVVKQIYKEQLKKESKKVKVKKEEATVKPPEAEKINLDDESKKKTKTSCCNTS